MASPTFARDGAYVRIHIALACAYITNTMIMKENRKLNIYRVVDYLNHNPFKAHNFCTPHPKLKDLDLFTFYSINNNHYIHLDIYKITRSSLLKCSCFVSSTCFKVPCNFISLTFFLPNISILYITHMVGTKKNKNNRRLKRLLYKNIMFFVIQFIYIFLGKITE